MEFQWNSRVHSLGNWIPCFELLQRSIPGDMMWLIVIAWLSRYSLSSRYCQCEDCHHICHQRVGVEAKLASGLVGGNQTNSLDAWNQHWRTMPKIPANIGHGTLHRTSNNCPCYSNYCNYLFEYICNYCPHVSTCSIGNQLQSQMRTANLLRFFDTALSQTILKLMPQISAAEKARQREGPAVRTEHDLRKVMRKSLKTRGLPKGSQKHT